LLLRSFQWNTSTNAHGALKEVGSQLIGPEGVALNAKGNVFIADSGNSRVIKIAQSSGPTSGRGGFRMRP
jgi:DNA-binding beta-propeller fold protein YncE